MKQVNIHQAKTHLSRLLEEVAAGEEVVIAKAGKPMVRLVAIEPARQPRRLGGLKGKIHLGPEFDEPLPSDIARALGVIDDE